MKLRLFIICGLFFSATFGVAREIYIPFEIARMYYNTATEAVSVTCVIENPSSYVQTVTVTAYDASAQTSFTGPIQLIEMSPAISFTLTPPALLPPPPPPVNYIPSYRLTWSRNGSNGSIVGIPQGIRVMVNEATGYLVAGCQSYYNPGGGYHLHMALTANGGRAF